MPNFQRTIVALILIIPAGLFCLIGLTIPTLTTVMTSFQKVDLLSSANEFVGGANYAVLLQDKTFFSALSFTLSLVGVRLMIVAIIPLLLALAVNEFGRKVRSVVRLLFTIPLALFAPVSTALVWTMVLNPQLGLFGGQPWLANQERAGQALRLVDGLSTFGLACGLGLIFYLAALRGWGDQTASRWKAAQPLLITWLIGLLATIALTLPFFTLNFVMTSGGPGNSTQTLAMLQYQQAFQQFRFGPAAAIATLTLAVLVLLGLLAGLGLVLSRLRLETTPLGQQTGLLGLGRRPLAVILLILTLCGSLSVCSISVLPLGWNALNSLKTNAELFGGNSAFFPAAPTLAAYTEIGQVMPLAQVLVNTLVPPLTALLLLQLPIAYAGALGIGAIRPLGKWSEWLLLPFSPWLFVTISPLIMVAFEGLRQADGLNTSAALAPPLILSVPMLFILTLFFKGQEPNYRAAIASGQSNVSAFFRSLILPSLPLAALLAAALLLVNLQALLWPLIVANSPEYFTFNVALVSLRGQFQTAWPVLAAAITLFQLPTFLFFFLIFGLLQVLYLDRLVLRTGSSDLGSG